MKFKSIERTEVLAGTHNIKHKTYKVYSCSVTTTKTKFQIPCFPLSYSGDTLVINGRTSKAPITKIGLKSPNIVILF